MWARYAACGAVVLPNRRKSSLWSSPRSARPPGLLPVVFEVGNGGTAAGHHFLLRPSRSFVDRESAAVVSVHTYAAPTPRLGRRPPWGRGWGPVDGVQIFAYYTTSSLLLFVFVGFHGRRSGRVANMYCDARWLVYIRWAHVRVLLPFLSFFLPGHPQFPPSNVCL